VTEYLHQAWLLFLSNWEWALLFWTFCVVKALNNSLRFDYRMWKVKFAIPDRWDFWFDPSISWENKYRSWLWKLLTPFSDFWHTMWTLWQVQFVITVSLYFDNWIFGVGITGIVGVYIIFNGIYAYARDRKFI